MKTLYNEAKKAFCTRKKLNLKLRRVSNLQTIDRLFKNDKNEFWKKIKRAGSQGKSKVEIDPNKVKDEYLKLFNTHHNGETMNDGSKGKFEKLEKQFEKSIFEHKLDSEIIGNMVAELKPGKAVGLRGVSHEMLKHANSPKLAHFLSLFYATLINHQIVPDGFNLSVIKPIIKDETKENNDLSNIRPIAISDSLANLYERITLKEIKKDHKDNKKQFGFKEVSSCAHAVEVFNQALLASQVRNRKLYICAVDASKAFDKVSREKLWDLMVDKKIEPAIVMAIKNYYSKSFMVVQIDSNFSEPFTTSVGLRQGGACSQKSNSRRESNLSISRTRYLNNR